MMDSSLKHRLFQACLTQLDQKAEVYRKAIASAEEAAANETKSSAGDKYETGRAMMHLEKEKNGVQLQQVLLLKSRLRQISFENRFTEVAPGALVETNIGQLFFLESIGKIMFEGDKFQVISIQSPIGQVLRGAKNGEVRNLNGRSIEILNLT